VNWLIFVSDVVFALIAAVLGKLGLSTLKAIRRWGVGKAFWIPVSVSSALFLIGSIVRIVNQVAVELDWSLTINTYEIAHVSWLLALCVLMYGIYNYSRKVKKATIVPVQDERTRVSSSVDGEKQKVATA